MIDFRIFCPHCGHMEDKVIDLLMTLAWLNHPLTEEGVMRKCSKCGEYYNPEDRLYINALEDIKLEEEKGER